MTNFTTSDYIAAIERELAKRATTYPRIIAKKKKQGMPDEEADELIYTQSQQRRRLQNALYILQSPPTTQVGEGMMKETVEELKREMKMRRKVYPRLLYYKRITPEVAEYETALLATSFLCYNSITSTTLDAKTA